MKQGRSITEVVAEVERQTRSRRDFVAPTEKLSLQQRSLKDETPALWMDTEVGNQKFIPTDLFHRQLSARLSIPWRYYERMMQTAPRLLEENANHWFVAESEARMVRTLDGRARAFLSSRYRPLDNYDLMEAVMPTLSKCGEIASCELTDTRIYIKAVNPSVQGEVVPGDTVQAGVVISNSEVGCGALRIEPFIFRLVCKNGMIAADSRLRKYHVGRAHSKDSDGVWELLRNETKVQSDRAFWMQVQDVTEAALEQVLFEETLEKLRTASKDGISDRPTRVVEVTQKRFNLHDGETESVLEHFLADRQMTRYGLANAITRHSQDVADYDRATELERIGGVIIEMPKTDWADLNREAGKAA